MIAEHRDASAALDDARKSLDAGHTRGASNTADASGTFDVRKPFDASHARAVGNALDASGALEERKPFDARHRLGISDAADASGTLDVRTPFDASDAQAVGNALDPSGALEAREPLSASHAVGVSNALETNSGFDASATELGTSALLSLYVDPSMRDRGVGTALVAALEEAMMGPRPMRLEAVYMTGKSNVAAIERVFAKRGWQPPAMRTYTLRFTTDDAGRMPWFGRVPLRDRDFEMFAWGELEQAERDALIASQRARPWIPEGLEFWRHDHAGFDPVSSLGLRYRGAVVGWTINHRLAADTTRISGAFVRDDLSRRGRLMALWAESITRMKADGVRWITSITPHQLAPMVAFLSRRCAPWATFHGETRGTHIDLPARRVHAI